MSSWSFFYTVAKNGPYCTCKMQKFRGSDFRKKYFHHLNRLFWSFLPLEVRWKLFSEFYFVPLRFRKLVWKSPFCPLKVPSTVLIRLDFVYKFSFTWTVKNWFLKASAALALPILFRSLSITFHNSNMNLVIFVILFRYYSKWRIA